MLAFEGFDTVQIVEKNTIFKMEKAQQPHDFKTESCSECAANASLYMNNSNHKICCLRKQINVSSAKESPRMIS